MTVVLRRDGLIGRVFFLSLQLDDCPGRSARVVEEYGTDVCTLVRRVLLVAFVFVAMAAAGATAGSAISIFGLLVAEFLTWAAYDASAQYLLTMGALLASVAGAWWYSRAQVEVRIEAYEVVAAWVRSKKRRLCPRVEFKR